MMLSNEILKSSELSIVDALHYKDHGPLLYWLATERTPSTPATFEYPCDYPGSTPASTPASTPVTTSVSTPC